MRHTPDRCDSCGGANLKTVKMVPTMKIDVPPPPKAPTTCHITKTCKCLDYD